MKQKVIKNFLDKEVFENIENLVTKDFHSSGLDFPWYFQDAISGRPKEPKNHHYFKHIIYHGGQINSDYWDYFKNIPIKLNAKKLHRMYVNFYHNTDKLVVHTPHIDHINGEIIPHKGCIISLNTCDGFTVTKETRVKSIKNQALFFNPSILHSSTSCTNANGRFNININYE